MGTHQPPSPASSGPHAGGRGYGVLAWSTVACRPETPLYLRKGGRLYLVGRLRNAPPSPTSDWRYVGGEIELEAERRSVGSWFILHDDFRVTNVHWHGGVLGAFVVPDDPALCRMR